MSIHEGHRQRLRESYLELGLNAFNDLNSLELLLCYAIPRRDTNELAHRLIDSFGSLSGVFDASIQELMSVQGVGENAAVLISMIPQLMKKIGISKTGDIKCIDNAATAAEYFAPRFFGEKDELLLLLCLDNKRSVICCREMGRGIVNSVEVNIRRMVETALKSKAASVLIAHNHPSGRAIPSIEDEHFTRDLFTALSILGIKLEDHIIIADNMYISMRDSGTMNYC